MFLFDITRVQPLPGRNLDLTFEDGFHGVVEVDRVVKNYTGVFAPLLQDEYFRQVKVNTELGSVVWPNGADLCPDVLYSQATGIPIPTSDYLRTQSAASPANKAQAAIK